MIGLIRVESCVILICLLSTVLWLLAIIVFVIGGHGQAFICRPLYQEPEFPALSQLLDNPGLFPNSHKFISTLAFDNDTIDVPFNKVLRECHENKPVYPVFKLNGVFNVETMTESKKWDKFHDKLDDIKVKLNHLKVLSPTLQNQLNDLLQALSVNLTAHRNYVRLSSCEVLHIKYLMSFRENLYV
ncbi:hypothetical protein LSTR_LSTR016513 [Laodelphax striatellus]|uniref:Uncharacterized protein n=1 Tax=Laodelphax striatellus TaxID=195883 RepID=A0A482X8C0_LAOST|nr:hypothetical protein LSTR_LSTR016513 [Laodelphax striatellus]